MAARAVSGGPAAIALAIALVVAGPRPGSDGPSARAADDRPSGPSIFDDDWKPPAGTTPPKKPAPVAPAESAVPAVPRLAPRVPKPVVPKPVTPKPPVGPVVPSVPVVPAIPALPPRAAPPGAAALAPAEKLIKDVFKAEYARTGVADRVALARALLREAGQDQGDEAATYVLLREARDLAAVSGEAEVAVDAARGLRDGFAADARSARDAERAALEAAVRGMQSAPPTVVTPAMARRGADLGMGLAERCLAAGDYAGAYAAATAADAAARRANDPSYWVRVQTRLTWIRTAAAEYDVAKAAIAALTNNPADPASNLAAGRFYAFVLDRPDWGLPLLAKGSDPLLKALSARDLAAAAASGDEQAAVADDWAAAARALGASAAPTTAPAAAPVVGAVPSVPAAPAAAPPTTAPAATGGTIVVKDAMQRRALFWYDKALANPQPMTNGLARTALEKRATDLRVSRLRRGGLVGEYFTGTRFNRRTFTRVDPKIEFNWRGQPADPTLGGEHFSVRWTGWVKGPVVLAKLIAIHDDAVRVWVDGRLVIDKWDTGHAGRDGDMVQFTGALQELKVDYAQGEGESAIGIGWRPATVKDSNKTKALAPDLLFYDPPPPGPVAAPPPAPESDGRIVLPADAAELHGGGSIQFEHAENDRPDRVSQWKGAGSWVSWDFEAAEGTYAVDLVHACNRESAGSQYVLSVGPAAANRLTATVADTGGWKSFRPERLGVVRLGPGGQTLRIKPISKPGDAVMDVTQVVLTPVK